VRAHAIAIGALLTTAVVVGAMLFANGGSPAGDAGGGASVPVAPIPEPPRAAGAVAAGTPREAVEPAAGATAPKDADDAPKKVADLPEEIVAKVEQAIDQCRFSCECLGIPLPRHQPRFTLADAKQMLDAEACLQAEILASALAEQDLLHTRLQANPTLGVQVAAGANPDVEALMRKQFPGWPDGYRYVEVDDGTTRRIAAWKVQGDEVLEHLVRNHESLTGDHARAVRAAYRRYM
jgi:hypothetical protein